MVPDPVLSPLTSPLMLVLFVMVHVGGISFERLVQATAPFIIPLIAVLALITLFPPLVTWVPNTVMGK